MKPESIQLPADPESALAQLQSASAEHPVVVFKKSPICPISQQAESEFHAWLQAHDGMDCSFSIIDVIAERPLARGLTEALDVKHESPQALLFQGGKLTWHGSHSTLTQAKFATLVG
ncbi:MAG: bacillithiol system redox-active protein YtxJ [Planctomycetes bacterium]|nr:bacillithiol system redox-active protein YtxJ [Planctomycetota bacterium]